MTRADPIRAALERLIKDTEYLAKGGEDLDRAWAAIATARAALDEQQGEGPSDEEIDDQFYAHCYTDDFGNELMESAHFRKAARALLARWGRQPTPPAEGEVGELVKYLRGVKSLHCQRAAELLQQQEAEIKRLRAQQTPVQEEAANPWKDALIDALVCAFLLNEENQSDPRRALHDLISWEVQLAKDPLINPPVHPTPVPVGMIPVEYWDIDSGARIVSEPSEEGPGGCWVVLDSRHVNPLTQFPTAKAAWDALQQAHTTPLPQGEVEK